MLLASRFMFCFTKSSTRGVWWYKSLRLPLSMQVAADVARDKEKKNGP